MADLPSVATFEDFIDAIPNSEVLIEAEDWNALGRAVERLVKEGGYTYVGDNMYTNNLADAFKTYVESGESVGIMKQTSATPNLTGGTQSAPVMTKVVENTETNKIELQTTKVTVGSTQFMEVMGSVFNGLAIGTQLNDMELDWWIDFCNHIGEKWIPNFSPVSTKDDLYSLHFTDYFFGDVNKYYVPRGLVEDVYEYAKDQGLYDKTYEVETEGHTTTGTYYMDLSDATYRSMIGKANWATYSDNDFLIPPPNASHVLAMAYNAVPQLRTAPYKQVSFGYADYQWILSIAGYEIEPLTGNVTNLNVRNSDGSTREEVVVRTVAGGGVTIGQSINEEEPVVNAIGEWGSRVVTLTSFIGYTAEKIASSVGFNHTNYIYNNLNSHIVDEGGVAGYNPTRPVDKTKSFSENFEDWDSQEVSLTGIKKGGDGSYSKSSKQLLPIAIENSDPLKADRNKYEEKAQNGTRPVVDVDPAPTEDILQRIQDLIDKLPTTQYPPTTPNKNEGDTPAVPPIPAIGGDASALFTVYNPTKGELASLGSVLWSSNVIQQIIQMFTNNPLDAIISLHILYATPTTGSKKEIKLGYVNTGVQSLEVTNQYTTIDCGTVSVAELYGDARDYDATTVHIFLPFIGIRQLHTEDIIGSTINVNYKVDVYTGTVLCNITVNKNGTSQILYTFEGNCSVNLPLTGADKSRQLASVGSVIVGGAVGGAVGATIAGVHAVSSGGVRANIQRSGNFSGNAGAMGGKRPYIIINRKIGYDAKSYNELYGYPSNTTTTLSNCNGFTRVKEVHVDNISKATDSEKREIEMLLKNGIIVN